MGKKRDRIDRLEKALSSAHRKQPSPDLTVGWRQDVMRHIRRLHTEGRTKARRPSTALEVQRMVFPFATATGLVAVALLAYLLTAVPAMDQDLLALLTQDPSGLLATQALGM